MVWEVDEPRRRHAHRAHRLRRHGPDRGAARAYRDRYEGTVGASTTDPGVAFSDGEGEFEIAYPEATVRTHARLRIDSTAAEYTVSIELTASEDGQERFSKRWDRTYPRDGQ